MHKEHQAHLVDQWLVFSQFLPVFNELEIYQTSMVQDKSFH